MMNNRNWTALPLAVMTSVLLASCGGMGLEGGIGAPPKPEVPAPTVVFIPQAGAAVNSGDGTAIGTVRISPNAQEIEMMNLVNEVRTKGTLNGQPATAGTCVDGTFKPGVLRPLTFDGMLAYASRMHAVYMTESGEYSHDETQTSHPAFFGRSGERVLKAYAMFGQTYPAGKAGFETLLILSKTATSATTGWLKSKAGHCEALMRPQSTRMGMGYTAGSGHYQDTDFKFSSWVQLFGD